MTVLAVIGLSQVPAAPIVAPAAVTAPASKPILLVASWYGHPYHGRKTASGEIFDKEMLTYASRTDPFGMHRRLSIGARSVVVRCNDRGPFIAGRDLDISEAAARQLGMLKAGVAIVEAEVVK